MGPREVGVLFLYLEKNRREKPLGMGRSVRFYLRTWLEVKTEEQPRLARHNIFLKILFNFNLYVIVTLQMDGRC